MPADPRRSAQPGTRTTSTTSASPTVVWGPATYELATFESGGTRTVIARLPHLSRYAIFGRPASRAATERITSVVAAAIAGTAPPSRAQAAPSPKPAQKDRGLPRTPSLGASIVTVRDETGRYPRPEALVPRLPSPEVQRYHRERGEALVLSCSRRKHLRQAITWIVLNPDGTHTVDGPVATRALTNAIPRKGSPFHGRLSCRTSGRVRYAAPAGITTSSIGRPPPRRVLRRCRAQSHRGTRTGPSASASGALPPTRAHAPRAPRRHPRRGCPPMY
jgi:hypothetical protein